MKATNLLPHFSSAASKAPIGGLRSGPSRRIDSLNVVTLQGSVMNEDQIFGVTCNGQDSIGETFGTTAHGLPLEAGEKSCAPKNAVLSAFSRLPDRRD